MPTVIETKARASLTLPVEVYDSYEKIAQSTRRGLDQVFSERLTVCASHRAQKPIYLNDAERQRLEKSVGANLSSAEEVINAVEKALSITLGSAKVQMKTELVDRLRSRCFEKDFGQWVAALAIEKLEEYTGIR